MKISYYFCNELVFVVVILLAVLRRPTVTTNVESIGCLPQENKNRWFLGETCVGGFSNQLFAIYSMVPTALALNSSLIFGEIATRHSFEHSWDEYATEKYTWLNFHNFFDFSYFQSYWKAKRNLTIIEKYTVASCLNELKSNFSEIRRNFFLGQHDDPKILHLVQQLNISIPIPSNYTLFKIGDEWKMMAFYYYWGSNDSLKLLQNMRESIRPNITLQYLIDGIISHLGKEYIAVHLRIEADKFKYNPKPLRMSDHNYLANIHKTIEFVASNSYFQSYYNINYSTVTLRLPRIINKNIINHTMTILSPHSEKLLPTVYIASGVFHPTFRKNDNHDTTHFMSKRALHSLELLKQHGIQNIFTQFNLTGDLLHLTQVLSAEQLAYVEQEVCRRSTHFIPSMYRSSFTYMVLRMKQMDSKKGSPLTMSDKSLHVQSVEYTQDHSPWGFRV